MVTVAGGTITHQHEHRRPDPSRNGHQQFQQRDEHHTGAADGYRSERSECGSTASNITINIPTTTLAAGTYHLIVLQRSHSG